VIFFVAKQQEDEVQAQRKRMFHKQRQHPVLKEKVFVNYPVQIELW